MARGFALLCAKGVNGRFARSHGYLDMRYVALFVSVKGRSPWVIWGQASGESLPPAKYKPCARTRSIFPRAPKKSENTQCQHVSIPRVAACA